MTYTQMLDPEASAACSALHRLGLTGSTDTAGFAVSIGCIMVGGLLPPPTSSPPDPDAVSIPGGSRSRRSLVAGRAHRIACSIPVLKRCHHPWRRRAPSMVNPSLDLRLLPPGHGLILITPAPQGECAAAIPARARRVALPARPTPALSSLSIPRTQPRQGSPAKSR